MTFSLQEWTCSLLIHHPAICYVSKPDIGAACSSAGRAVPSVMAHSCYPSPQWEHARACEHTHTHTYTVARSWIPSAHVWKECWSWLLLLVWSTESWLLNDTILSYLLPQRMCCDVTNAESCPWFLTGKRIVQTFFIFWNVRNYLGHLLDFFFC